ncbi:phosphatidylethanolamine-binding protein 4 [Rhea pennata]|uniref:phosphatidylethanolamine-binding protein 4 n=1 Tax=Rhea pennata TaxID=8795 RepID=UPI002E25B447
MLFFLQLVEENAAEDATQDEKRSGILRSKKSGSHRSLRAWRWPPAKAWRHSGQPADPSEGCSRGAGDAPGFGGQGGMRLLGAALLAAGLLGAAGRAEETPRDDRRPRTCFFEPLGSLDSKFCRGDLEVIYPELGDVGCTYIPECRQYRRRISREWSSPQVRYARAGKSKKYVLIMVDPDAPSRANPRNRFWRHWLVTDIRGADLRAGNPKGHVLADYVRPAPPARSGYHRYQLRLYEQPAHEAIALSAGELVSPGAWSMERFVERFRLGSPVASTQFLTKHHGD